MSLKKVDKHNRLRSITVGFRVSPEEHKMLNRIVALSGLSKREYCYRKCMDREIVVQGNPRVYKAFRNELTELLNELKRIQAGEPVPTDLVEIIDQINKTLCGFKGDG
jgi:hypothetical protein